jgi:hypothetical protein
VGDLDLTEDPKERVLDLTQEKVNRSPLLRAFQVDPGRTTKPYNQEETRENTRGDLARGLLWLLTLAIGGVLAFIGLGRLDGTVLTQSIFPSLVALAGTALGFYFGSQTAKESAKTPDSTAAPGSAPAPPAPGGERPDPGQNAILQNARAEGADV